MKIHIKMVLVGDISILVTTSPNAPQRNVSKAEVQGLLKQC